jgi:acetyl/propionyl-CoA carboxylase alpha subunit
VRYWVEIAGRRVDAVVEPRGDGRFAVTVGGRTYVADLRRIGRGPLYSLLLGARSCEVAATRERGSWRLDLRGRTFGLGVETEQEHAARVLDETGGSRRTAEVKASMPGFVTRVLVAAGDEVVKGTPLLIIEAMKMENEIRAEGAGVVAEIVVNERQIVNNGDVLIRME